MFPFIVRLTETRGRPRPQQCTPLDQRALSKEWLLPAVQAGPSASVPGHVCGLNHLRALISSRQRCGLNCPPPIMALQRSCKSLSSDLLPWNMTGFSVMAELIIRNGLLADSWMLIMIGTSGPFHPNLLMFVGGGKMKKPQNMKGFLFGGRGGNSKQGRSGQAALPELTGIWATATHPVVVRKGLKKWLINCYFLVKRGWRWDVSMQSQKLALIKFEVTFGEVCSERLSLVIQFDFTLCPRFVKSF